MERFIFIKEGPNFEPIKTIYLEGSLEDCHAYLLYFIFKTDDPWLAFLDYKFSQTPLSDEKEITWYKSILDLIKDGESFTFRQLIYKEKLFLVAEYIEYIFTPGEFSQKGRSRKEWCKASLLPFKPIEFINVIEDIKALEEEDTGTENEN